jgi:hypothetical protein
MTMIAIGGLFTSPMCFNAGDGVGDESKCFIANQSVTNE